MIYLKKSTSIPTSLALEKVKAKGSYTGQDVLKQLKSDFYNKCYICEAKDLTCLNVEHFIPHKKNTDLKFDWNNLFLACVHCNSTKSDKYENLLNCTDPNHEIDRRIRYIYKPFYPIHIEARDNDPKTIETVDLLKSVYEGTTNLKTIEASNLSGYILEEFLALVRRIKDYRQSTPETKTHFEMMLRNCLSRSSAFTAIKRDFIKESIDLQDLVVLFD